MHETNKHRLFRPLKPPLCFCASPKPNQPSGRSRGSVWASPVAWKQIREMGIEMARAGREDFAISKTLKAVIL